MCIAVSLLGRIGRRAEAGKSTCDMPSGGKFESIRAGLVLGQLEDGSGVNSCLRVSKTQNVDNKAGSPPRNPMQLGPPMRPIAEESYVGKSTKPPCL